MKRSGWAKVLYVAAGVLSLVVSVLISGAMIALVNELRLWAYPVMFFFGFGLIAFVFVLMVPPSRKRSFSVLPAIKERMVRKHEARVSHGFWKWVHGRGPLVLLIVTTIVLGPFIGALVARLIGLNERRAWMYMSIANAVSVAIWVSVYLGVVGWLRAAFMSAFLS